MSEFPSWVFVQDFRSFLGIGPNKWSGPHFATLQHGTFQLYKVSEEALFRVEINEDACVAAGNDLLSRSSTEGLALRVVSPGPTPDSSNRLFYLITGSSTERDSWFEEMAELVPESGVTRGSGAPRRRKNDYSSPSEASCGIKDAVKSNRILLQGILLCSATGNCATTSPSSSEVDHVEKKSWSRRYFQLTCTGQLECFSVKIVACISLQSADAQILVEEAPAQLMVSPAAKSRLSITASPSFSAKSEKKAVPPPLPPIPALTSTTRSEQSLCTLLDSNQSDDSSSVNRGSFRRLSSDLGTIDSVPSRSYDDCESDEHSLFKRSPSGSSDSDTSDSDFDDEDFDDANGNARDLNSSPRKAKAKPRLKLRQLSWRRSSTGSLLSPVRMKTALSTFTSNPDFTCFFPFTVAGEKVKKIPAFPMERTFTYISTFWRKVVFPSSVTVGTISEEQRNLFTSWIKEYLEFCQQQELQLRTNQTKQASIVLKGWLMKRTSGKLTRWKRRYCVLLSSKEFVHYKNALDGSKCRVIHLNKILPGNLSIKEVSANISPNQRALQLRLKMNTVSFFPCDFSEDVLQQWQEALTDLAQHNQLNEGDSDSIWDTFNRGGGSAELRSQDEDLLERPRLSRNKGSQLLHDSSSTSLLLNDLDDHLSLAVRNRCASAPTESPKQPPAQVHSPVRITRGKSEVIRTNQVPSHRSSSFDEGFTAEVLRNAFRHRSASGGDFEALKRPQSLDVSISQKKRVVERTTWQRLTGNLPIECLSLSPYTGKLLAEQLTRSRSSSGDSTLSGQAKPVTRHQHTLSTASESYP